MSHNPDPKGLEAAWHVYCELAGECDMRVLTAAIRAYEAHKAPLEHRGDCSGENFTCQLCAAYNEGYDAAVEAYKGAVEAHNAAAVRAELLTEIARIDAQLLDDKGSAGKYATDEERFEASPRAVEFSPGWQENVKASTVPVNLPFERIPQHGSDPGFGPVPPRPTVVPLHPDNQPDEHPPSAVPMTTCTLAPPYWPDAPPSAVPDEVREVVEWLRETADGSESTTARTYQRIADLLEQKAREIEELKEALENAVVRLRITQELAQQLADLKT